jgi:hypothetical protein
MPLLVLAQFDDKIFHYYFCAACNALPSHVDPEFSPDEATKKYS